MKKLFFLVVASFFVFGCKERKARPIPIKGDEAVSKPLDHPGKKMLETECYICHNPKVSYQRIIAPPMAAVKQRYIGDNTTKEEFTEALIAWVNDPEQETKMPNAQRRFGKMPYLPYPDDAVAQIADYLYDNEVGKAGMVRCVPVRDTKRWKGAGKTEK